MMRFRLYFMHSEGFCSGLILVHVVCSFLDKDAQVLSRTGQREVEN